MTIIETYIVEQTPEQQERLRALYLLIKEILPQAEEKISYAMPTFWQGRNIIHFAAFKKHLGLYPGPKVIETFADQLRSAGYTFSKGAIQFPFDREFPLELIREISQEALKQNGK